jgi:hypothetical protein
MFVFELECDAGAHRPIRQAMNVPMTAKAK